MLSGRFLKVFLCVVIISSLISAFDQAHCQTLREKIKERVKEKIKEKMGLSKQNNAPAGNSSKKSLFGCVKESFNYKGQARTYLIYLPSSRNEKKPMPAVFLFHGGGGSAKQAVDSYGMADLAEKEGFILVAPNGAGRMGEDLLLTWNVFFGFGYAQKSNSDDIGFVIELVKYLTKKYNIDTRHAYATGISNGGSICHWLAADPANPFAAIAPVVAPMGGRQPEESVMKMPPKPQKPVPTLIIYGELDRSVPPEGGLQKRSANNDPKFITSAAETVKFWVDANHCSAVPEKFEDDARKAACSIYSGGDASSEVVFWMLHNQGHAWPGGQKPRDGADTPSPCFNANDEIIKFFKKH